MILRLRRNTQSLKAGIRSFSCRKYTIYGHRSEGDYPVELNSAWF